MKYLSVCSGIEAASVAWSPLEWTATAVAEVEAFPSAVLAHHYPLVPNWGDITRFQDLIAHSLRADGFDASEDGTGRGTPLVPIAPAIAFAENQRAELTTSDTAGSLKVGGGKPGQGYPAIQSGMAVRRLTPRECERLQGFPDDYTLIPYRGKPAADGPRYKALGNSMAVPVMAWIGRRLQQVHDLP